MATVGHTNTPENNLPTPLRKETRSSDAARPRRFQPRTAPRRACMKDNARGRVKLSVTWAGSPGGYSLDVHNRKER